LAGISKSLEQKLVADGGIDSDTLELAMEQCANTGSKLIEHLVDQLTALLEPFIMCVLAVLVGGLLIAMYLPIFQLGNVM